MADMFERPIPLFAIVPKGTPDPRNQDEQVRLLNLSLCRAADEAGLSGPFHLMPLLHYLKVMNREDNRQAERAEDPDANSRPPTLDTDFTAIDPPVQGTQVVCAYDIGEGAALRLASATIDDLETSRIPLVPAFEIVG